MMELNISADMRDTTGTGSSNQIRREKMIPAVIYARDEETIHIKVSDSEFRMAYREAGAATIIGLAVGEENIPAIIKEVQKDPVKDEILHVDFQKVSMDEEIRVTLPIILVNRDNIKAQPSILTQQLDELEIECLPMDLPEDIEVDVQSLEIGDSISVSDLEIAEDEKITILRDLDDVICALSEFVEEEIDELDDEDLDVEPELVSDEDDEDEDESEE